MSYKIRDQMPRRQLTEAQVQAIRKRLRAGETQKSIAENHEPEIGRSTVGSINTGLTWGWLPMEDE